jgi:nucleoside-diphosphate-sugar epimerase
MSIINVDGLLNPRSEAERELAVLSEDCPSLRFAGKFADIEALNRGDTAVLRPFVDATTRVRVSRMADPGTEVALVLGGNGFVGAHLVARLSRAANISKVIAAVRHSAQQTGEEKLEQTLRQYRIANVDRDKIEVIDATPTQTMFGLQVERYRQLSEDVDMLFDCAGSTNYSASYRELRDDGFKSLLRVLQFSIESKRKHVTYMSSVGAYFYRGVADFRRPDSWWYSGYSRMKWVNSAVLRWLALDGLFAVTLCEAPYVFGATDIGLDPGRLYSWWRIVEIARSIGMIWDGPGMIYAPVDVLTDVLVLNALAPDRLIRLVPCNPVPYHNRMLAELLGVELVSWSRFMDAVSRGTSAQRVGSLLSSNIDELVRIVNQHGPLLPAGSDVSWCDNRRLYAMYLSNLDFRDVSLERSRDMFQAS